jgi:hypothetical protein
MHTIELLEEALQLAEESGFDVRRQWLGENIGGPCRVGPQRILLVNLSLTAEEQLKHAIGALAQLNPLPITNMSPTLRRLLS